MAHFAGIDKDGIVINTIVIPDANEANGPEYCHELTKNNKSYSGVVEWLQTSYNTYGNVHLLGGNALRGNYAVRGSIYLQEFDAFVDPQPFESWILNEETWLWEAPTPRPDDKKIYQWDEDSTSWVEVIQETE